MIYKYQKLIWSADSYNSCMGFPLNINWFAQLVIARKTAVEEMNGLSSAFYNYITWPADYSSFSSL